MDKVTAIKIKYADNTYSEKIPFTVLAENVEWNENKNLVDILGTVDLSKNIQDQITQLYNNKIGLSEINNYVNNQLNNKVTSWLDQNVTPTGSAVLVDKSLSVDGAAADAKVIGDNLDDLKSAMSTVESDLYTSLPTSVLKTHTDKGISSTGNRSLGITGSTVKIYAVTSGNKYRLKRENAPIYYGFANTIQGNNTLYEGGTSETDIAITAPDGYVYLYMQDVNNAYPNGESSVDLISSAIDIVSSNISDIENDIIKIKEDVYTEESILPHKTHTDKGISSISDRSLGITGSTVKVFQVSYGKKYKLTRNNAPVKYGFANTDPGNNTLYEGGQSETDVVITAPDYTYLYMQDVNSSYPNGTCEAHEIIDEISILNRNVTPLVENTSSILDRVKGKFIYHIGVGKNNNIVIPSQSLADIDKARRLGFNVIELNVRKTADDKYICLHGSSGAFGQQFLDKNGDSVADVLVSSMTLAQIKENIRYKSNYERYRTAPYTLQECLYECKKLNMIPLVEFQDSYTDEISILNSIMGKNNYLLGTYSYDRSQINSNAPMYSYLTNANAESIVAKCRKSGGAYIAGLNVTNAVYSDFTEEDWKNLFASIHSNGFMVSSAYGSEQLNQVLMRAGIDVINSGHSVNEISTPNLINIVDSVNFDGLSTTGSVDGGIMSLSDGDTITPVAESQTVLLGASSMHIRFSGEIMLNMGDISGTFASDGKDDVWFSTYHENSAPTFTLTSVGNVQIYSLSYKAMKC